jgi:selenocysteine-specific elongation factor
MLAGATGIDFALLVIAADDGVMPQTDEHLDILQLLGITQGAVALTKIDAVAPERVVAVQAELAARTAGTPAAEWPVFPLSSLSGAGVAALDAHLRAQAQAQTRASARGRFRMAIDRAFTLTGIGTVVTGTVHAGSVAPGDALAVVPGAHGQALAARVRSLHAQDRAAERGVRGERCALNLPGLEKAQLERGQWIQDAAFDNLTERFDASLRVSPREARALVSGATVHLHHGTADAMARVAVLDAARVEPGANALVAFALDRPLAVARGDRFVIRDGAAQRTIGGGTVLDAAPLGAAPRRGRRAPARLALLAALRDAPPPEALAAWLAQDPVPLARLASRWNLRDDELDALIAASGARVAAGIAFAPTRWQALRDGVLQTVRQTHAREPELAGVEQQRLRRIVAPALSAEAFAALVEEMLAEGALARRGAFLALPEHKAELGREQRVRWERVQPLLLDAPFDPPRVRDLARATGIPEPEVRHLLRTVARVGDVALVAPDHFFALPAVRDLADIAAELAAAHGVARAADFRDRIGTGRKVAIQILEFFDRVGYTRRVRDDHVVRRANPWR